MRRIPHRQTDNRGVEYYAGITEAQFLALDLTGWAYCPTCRRAWNDDKSTSVTPAPSGRCPFEYEHKEQPMTDHTADIAKLRAEAREHRDDRRANLVLETAADLLEIHDATGISLDGWPAARGLVELLIGHPIAVNGA